MKKIILFAFLLLTVSTLTACAPSITQLSPNQYQVEADDSTWNAFPLNFLLGAGWGCGTAKERFAKAVLGICKDGFDVKDEEVVGGGKDKNGISDLCRVKGTVICRAASSEIK